MEGHTKEGKLRRERRDDEEGVRTSLNITDNPKVTRVETDLGPWLGRQSRREEVGGRTFNPDYYGLLSETTMSLID